MCLVIIFESNLHGDGFFSQPITMGQNQFCMVDKYLNFVSYIKTKGSLKVRFFRASSFVFRTLPFDVYVGKSKQRVVYFLLKLTELAEIKSEICFVYHLI